MDGSVEVVAEVFEVVDEVLDLVGDDRVVRLLTRYAVIVCWASAKRRSSRNQLSEALFAAMVSRSASQRSISWCRVVVTRAPSLLWAPIRCLLLGLGGSRGDGLSWSLVESLHDTTALGCPEAADWQQGDAP